MQTRLRSSSSRYRLTTPLLVLSIIGSVLAAPASAQDPLDDGAPARCQIVGTPGPDVLVGTDEDDIICGLGGGDILHGAGGDDELIGGDGDDQLIGGLGDDKLWGGDGSDGIFGGRGNDVLRGGNDHDQVVGGNGNDVLRGGDGDDQMAGGNGTDVLRGGNGNDNLRGAGGKDTLFGGPGDDILRGGAGNDRMRGGPEADICLDSFAKTSALNCEFGRGGDDREVAVGRQLWNLFGNDEFVYELAITKPCLNIDTCGVTSFLEVVHVVDDVATSSLGSPALTAAELFAEAEVAEAAGRRVSFDDALGLPTYIDSEDGATLGVQQVDLRDDLRSRYEDAVNGWELAAISDYTYTVATVCFCPFTTPMRVQVENSTEVSSETLAEGAGAWSNGAKTIDQHLAELGEILDGHAIVVRAEFDDRGVPTMIRVDESLLIADEELTITISDFVDATRAAPAPVPAEPEAEPSPEPAPASPDLEELGIDIPTIVEVRGIEVNEDIADQVEALLAASVEAGLALSGGGFRDPARQIELRKKNCGTSDFAIYEMPAGQCNPPTAKPGQSQHELGLAIDFTNNGRLVTSRTDPAFVWLAANAGAFGFINLPSEPWHFSTTGN